MTEPWICFTGEFVFIFLRAARKFRGAKDRILARGIQKNIKRRMQIYWERISFDTLEYTVINNAFSVTFGLKP